MSGLEGFRLLVTGGGSGIGRAIVLGASAAGCRVAIADLQPQGMEEVVGSAPGPGEVVAFVADVTDAASVSRLVEGCVARLGGLDGLVNCAGILHLKPSVEVSDEEFERVLAVNLVGAFRVTRDVGRIMLAAGSGSIVEIASLSSFGGFPGRGRLSLVRSLLCADFAGQPAARLLFHAPPSPFSHHASTRRATPRCGQEA